MRIVAGQYGGRKLAVPKGRDIRPTSDKVRGAIFNALESRGVVEGVRVLDCFCGSGALGLEALSRAAVWCTFVDKDRTSLDLTRRNAESLGVQDADFVLKDVRKLEPCAEPYNLVFLDPPYGEGLVALSLDILHNQNYIGEDTVLAVELEKGFDGMEVGQPYVVLDEKTYGDTAVLFLELRH